MNFLESDSTRPVLLKAIGLVKAFRHGLFKRVEILAVNNVDVNISCNERLCLVGESGSGKTTLAKLLLLLIKPDRGTIHYRDIELTSLNMKELRSVRWKLQYIPQHPENALDPRWKLYDSIAEPLRILKLAKFPQYEKKRVYELAHNVGLRPEILSRRPGEVSGGELQRAVIARALAVEPELLIADEPTSMLDPLTQAKIVYTLLRLQQTEKFALLFITHDIWLAKHVCNRILVMYSGQIVEEGPIEDVLSRPLHPYTKGLVSVAQSGGKLIYEAGDVNEISLTNSKGCSYADLCTYKHDLCFHHEPPLIELCNDRRVRCWLYAGRDKR